eukprot:4292438-Amphidinium_carterae.1
MARKGCQMTQIRKIGIVPKGEISEYHAATMTVVSQPIAKIVLLGFTSTTKPKHHRTIQP